MRPATLGHPQHGKHIVGLDAIRFLAAMFVLLHHLGFAIWAGPGGIASITYRWPESWGWFGWVGVEVFFTLSGFVIAYSAESASSFFFFKSRFVRLIPGTIVCSTLTACVLWMSGSEHGQLLLRAWARAAIIYVHGPWIDGAYWTLPIEVSFYGWIFFLILGGWKRRIPVVIGTMGLCSSAAWVLITAAAHLPLSAAGMHMIVHLHYLLAHNWAIFLTLLTHGCFFAEGVFLYLCLMKAVTRRRIAILLLCSIGAYIEICDHARTIVFHWARVRVPYHPAVPCIVWTISVVLIVVSVRVNASLVLVLKRHVLWFRWAGLMTYPLYLINMEIGYVLIANLRRYLPDTISMLIASALLLGLAYAIARFPEPWLQRIFKRIFSHIGGWSERRKLAVAG